MAACCEAKNAQPFMSCGVFEESRALPSASDVMIDVSWVAVLLHLSAPDAEDGTIGRNHLRETEPKCISASWSRRWSLEDHQGVAVLSGQSDVTRRVGCEIANHWLRNSQQAKPPCR